MKFWVFLASLTVLATSHAVAGSNDQASQNSNGSSHNTERTFGHSNGHYTFHTGGRHGAVDGTTGSTSSFNDLAGSPSSRSHSRYDEDDGNDQGYEQRMIRPIASPAPEPTGLALALLGLAGVVLLSRKRKSR